MSRREALLRYNLIINKLRKAPSSFLEIKQYLAQESDLLGYNLELENRTFYRVRNDIFSLFGIEIKYDYSLRKYALLNQEEDNFNTRILESFETIHALKEGAHFADCVDFEKSKALGLEHFHGILHAVKNKLQLNFVYKSFWQDEATLRKTNPFLLKEFKQRWYLIAKDLKDDKLKTYSLDRFEEIEITKKKFNYPAEYNPGKLFSDSYGIIASVDGSVPQKVVLSFDPHQGKYVKSLPLHTSQIIVIDNEDEIRVELKVHLAYDFIKELISYGDGVKILEPECLINEIKEIHYKSFQQYL